MKRLVLSLAAFALAASGILLIYWCGGGNFECGQSLGVVAYGVVVLGGLASVVTWAFTGSGERR